MKVSLKKQHTVTSVIIHSRKDKSNKTVERSVFCGCGERERDDVAQGKFRDLRVFRTII